MKTLYRMLIGLFAVIAVGCSSVTTIAIDHHGVIRGPEQSIVIHEGGQVGPPLGSIKANQYMHLYIAPGSHEFTGMFDDGHGNGIITYASLQAGKTYYFQIVQLPALAIQDILIKPRQASEARTEMAAFTNVTPGQVLANPDQALVYFYYALTKEEQAALKAQQANSRKLAKELGCSETEMREGTCQ